MYIYICIYIYIGEEIFARTACASKEGLSYALIRYNLNSECCIDNPCLFTHAVHVLFI